MGEIDSLTFLPKTAKGAKCVNTGDTRFNRYNQNEINEGKAISRMYTMKSPFAIIHQHFLCFLNSCAIPLRTKEPLSNNRTTARQAKHKTEIPP